MLTPEQYGKNVAVTGEGRDRVEFAIKLPGKGDDEHPVWLPIDAKFPQSDYQRLVEASELADVEAVEAAAKKLLAESVCGKAAKQSVTNTSTPRRRRTLASSSFPPKDSTPRSSAGPGSPNKRRANSALLFIAGPTTLTALLNSLQMGFHTLAIQKQSGEVSKLLGQVKGDFEKFSVTLKSVKSKLDSASNSIEQ